MKSKQSKSDIIDTMWWSHISGYLTLTEIFSVLKGIGINTVNFTITDKGYSFTSNDGLTTYSYNSKTESE
jgi:uncharacterized lipoprotein YddW (UPF0748 family)